MEGMERMTSPEEKPLRDRVVEALYMKGIKNAEALELLIQWSMQREDQAASENTSIANIECEIDKALVYAEAGYILEAQEEMAKVIEAAQCENNQDLFLRVQNVAYFIERHYKKGTSFRV
jgi:hypothetical protein